ncbi:MAG: Aspartate aminotransferase [Chlamydiae bacterium]|nr:Aspartate aminotransferase [Chlamydiota bacterium]
MTFFDTIDLAPPDPIFGLSASYRADPRLEKVTFVTGYYRTEELKTPLLEAVSEVETQLANEKLKKEYLPIAGDGDFVSAIGKLAFREKWDEKEICGVQAVGGTGALSLIGLLAKQWTRKVAVPVPTWVNHWAIFSSAGLEIEGYPYYKNKTVLFEQMCEKLQTLPKKSCVLLHASCHNPSGMDLSKEQWQELSELCLNRELFPIFDMAYQGFAMSLEEDSYSLRLFMEKGHELALTYTCAKNFSIYSERAGALFVVARSDTHRSAIMSQLKKLIRGRYSNPPIHGSTIVKRILESPSLLEKWEKELSQMRQRMQSVRTAFADAVTEKKPQEDWHALREGSGLFYYSELPPSAVEWLRSEKGFYLMGDGRINLTGINQKNFGPFVEAFLTAREIE